MEYKGFKNIEEFAKDRLIYKTMYNELSLYEKQDLKKYVYGMDGKEFYKDIIWEYLNEPLDSAYYINTTIVLSKFSGRKK